MKCILVHALLVSVGAFVTPSTRTRTRTQLPQRFASVSDDTEPVATLMNRNRFLQQATAVSLVAFSTRPDAAVARGRATFEVAYRKFTPRIVAGGAFYAKDMKQLVATADFAGITNALREPPARSKDDLTKADSGVAARARQAGQFSDARVLVAADLFAAAFSESSISPKTKKMQAAVIKMRSVIAEMESVAKEASGEAASGGLFGMGAKKVDKAEAAKKLRALYVEGGNAYNEYVLVANENLALQFDKLAYIK